MKRKLSDVLKELHTRIDKLVNTLESEKKLIKKILENKKLPRDMVDMSLLRGQPLLQDLESVLDRDKVEVGFIYGKRQENIFLSFKKYFQEMAEKHNVNIVCFNIDEVDLENEVVHGMVISGESVERRITKIPPYICNMALFSKTASIKTMRRLRIMDNLKVTNPVNRFNQSVVFDIIDSLLKSEELLLPYDQLTPSTIIEYIQKYGNIFLIPERGVLYHKAIIIEKNDESNDNLYNINVGNSQQACDQQEVFMNIKKMIRDRRHMVVKGTKVLKWNGFPLEARAYIQKGATGKWEITELVAKNEIFSRGSMFEHTSDKLGKVLMNIAPELIDKIEENMVNYSLNICTYLEYYLNDLGNCILDYVIDETGKPYVIYFGGWEQNDFLYSLDKKIWQKYISNSFEYLLYLANKNNDQGVADELG